MCTYSMVLDYGRYRLFPHPQDPNPFYVYPMPPPFPIPTPEESAETMRRMEAYFKLLESAKEADKELDQPDCEDPAKVEWLESLEMRYLMLKREREALEGIEDETERIKAVRAREFERSPKV